MTRVIDEYRKKDFWVNENLRYVEPHFRMRKCAKLVNGLIRGVECDLLDVGCGPATLHQLLDPHITYYGIDIAIQEPASCLLETDFLESRIAFKDLRFDIVVACGVFEYVGRHQLQKFAEIRQILKDNGRFVMSYINFGHFRRHLSANYNNIQSIEDLSDALGRVFRIERCVPVYHHWRHHPPSRWPLAELQMNVNCKLPFVSPWLAGEFLFVCSGL